MNEQELQTLKKKLAEWAGFTYSGKYDERDWLYPSGELKIGLPDFFESLDACFKWLVPKILKNLLDIPNGVGDKRVLQILFDMWLEEIYKGWAGALALCLAIEKLIDKEEKDEQNG